MLQIATRTPERVLIGSGRRLATEDAVARARAIRDHLRGTQAALAFEPRREPRAVEAHAPSIRAC